MDELFFSSPFVVLNSSHSFIHYHQDNQQKIYSTLRPKYNSILSPDFELMGCPTMLDIRINLSLLCVVNHSK